MNIKYFITEVVKKAIFSIGLSGIKIHVCQSKKIQNCDYQINGIMSIAKNSGYSAINLAKLIVDNIKANKAFKYVEISKTFFINIILNEKWIATQLNKINIFSYFNNKLEKKPKTIVVDYSSPNMAKEMHVGHLRSTIIGDSISKILLFLGHNVIKINHVGDWGIQFGMIIAYLEKEKINKKININLNEIEFFYKKAKKLYDENEKFAEHARNYIVKLQSGDKNCIYLWKKIVDMTIEENQKIYNLLDVSLEKKNIFGESFYKDMLPSIVNDLKEKKIAVENNGSIVIFLNEFKNKLGEPIGVVIQRNDGSYLYTTIDIACLKYRCETLNADRILYFVDSRQHQHLMQILYISIKAGYIKKGVSFEHHMFGMILSSNGKPFKTRSGKTIKLYDLLQEAINRAFKLVVDKNPNLSKPESLFLAKRIGIGAIKYFDLSKNRNTNYEFNWDNILNFEGNTSPYIQYTYTRIFSVIKKSNIELSVIQNSFVSILTVEEKKLSIQLLKFQETIQLISENCLPNILCNYLYELAVIFSNFYENCSILYANKKIFFSRLKLSYLTLKTIKTGLNLLGINTINKM